MFTPELLLRQEVEDLKTSLFEHKQQVYAPVVAALPSSPFDGQQVLWNPVIAGATFDPVWRMLYIESSLHWWYMGGEPARSDAFLGWTSAPAVSNVGGTWLRWGAATTNGTTTTGHTVTLPVDGNWHMSARAVARTATSVAAGSSNDIRFAILRDYSTNPPVLAVGEAGYAGGPIEGHHFHIDEIVSVFGTSANRVIGLGVQIQAYAAASGIVWNPFSTRFYVYPTTIEAT